MRVALIAILLAASGCCAQEPTTAAVPPATGSQPQKSTSSQTPTITVPAGTRVLLSLVRPVSTRTTKAGDKVYLQTSAPVVVGSKMAIPTGTSLEGTLDKTARAVWSKRRAEFHLRLVSLVFPNGYKVSVPGSVEVTNNLEESTSTYGDAGVAGPLAAIGASAGGTTIGAVANGVRGAAIGGAIGGVVGLAIAIPLIVHHGGVFMDVGTAVDMVLESPLTVDQERVLNAASQSTPPPIIPPRRCYEPGSPGTPDVIIPGTPAIPGTPPTIIPGPPNSPPTVIPGTPGTPGTPATVIPGTPATPGTYYPCSPR